MAVARFTLSQLPRSAILNVLSTMDFVSLVLLSLVSNKSKLLVKSLNIKACRFRLEVENSTIALSLALFRHYQQSWDVICLELQYREYPNQKCDAYQSHAAVLFEKPLNDEHPPERLTVPKKFNGLQFWLSHFKTLFSSLKCGSLEFYENKFDLQTIRSHFQNVPPMIIYADSLESNRQILKTFPTVSSIIMGNKAFEESKIPSQLLIGNINELTIGTTNSLSLLELDDILQVNAFQFSIHNAKLQENEFNRFLKLWIRGCWPRTERILLTIRTEDEAREPNKNMIFKNIKYQEIPSDQEHEHYTSSGWNWTAIGGYNIWRKDGTRATLELEYSSMRIYLGFYVWHSHCIREK